VGALQESEAYTGAVIRGRGARAGLLLALLSAFGAPGVPVLALAFPVSAPPARGRIVGTVSGPDDSRLTAVAIVVSAAASSAAIRVSTGPEGEWSAPDLAPGDYRVEAFLAGFQARTVTGVRVRPGLDTVLDLRLEVARVHETVSVTRPAPRTVLDAAELREVSAWDLGQALGWKAGLWRLRKGGIGGDVVLRGLQSRDLNVLIDGQRVYGACPNHMDPVAFHVDLAEVERVEVERGPFDLESQGGLGGTLNVVTREPEAGWHAGAALAAASAAAIAPSLTLGYGGRRLSSLAGFSFRRADVYRDGAGRLFTELGGYGPEARQRRAYGTGSAWARLAWRASDRRKLDLAYSHQDGGATLYPYLAMDAVWDDADRLNLRYQASGLGARGASVRVQAYFTRVDHWMSDEWRTSSIGRSRAYSMGTRADTRTLGGRAEGGAGGWRLGAEWYERRWDASNAMAVAGYAPQPMIPGTLVRVAGAFAEYERRFGSVGLSAGARLDRAHGAADPGKADVTLYQAYQAVSRLSATDTLPGGKLRVAWRRSGLELSAGLGHVARAPEPSERYLALRRAGSDWVGNPGLGASRNTQLDGSLALARAGFRAELDVYSSRVAGYVTAYEQPRRQAVAGVSNLAARSFANVDATLRGLELELVLPILFQRVSVSGGASYVRGRQDGDRARGIEPGNLAEMPPLRGRLSVRYDDGRCFGRLEGLFAADQRRIFPALLESATPGWGVVDAAAGVRAGRLRLTAGVSNLFDRLYVEHLSYQRDPFRSGVKVPEPGRTLYARMALEL
jgi:iron complex outermembrane receptor protein